MTGLVVSFVAGVVFAIGLAIGGMTQPAKVIDFLDVAGNWDPSLAFVMGGAMSVYAAAYWTLGQRARPILASTFSLPTRTDIDGKLVGGAVLFGVGWGLGGFCPGPAVTSLGSGGIAAIVLVGGMLVGMALHAATTDSPSTESNDAMEPATTDA